MQNDLHFFGVGEGHPALVVNGGPGMDHSYMRGLDVLGDVLRLTYYDQRGEGRSTRGGLDGMTMERYADDLEALRRSAAIERPVLIGHSHGASVALEFVVKYSDVAAALVLIAGVGTYDYEMVRPPTAAARLDERARAVLARTPETDGDVIAQLRARLPAAVAEEASIPAILAAYRETTCSIEVWRMQAQGFAENWSILSSLGGVRVPTLVIGGADDWISPPAMIEQLSSALPASELVMMPNCGHFPWVEQPAVFFETVRDFLRRSLDLWGTQQVP